MRKSGGIIIYVVYRSYRDVAQFGRALRSGRRGRRFKSCHPDHKDRLFSGLFPFVLHFVLHKSLEVLKYDLICFLGFIA